MRQALTSLAGMVSILALCGCGPGGVAVLALLLTGGDGDGNKKKSVALTIVSQYGAPSPDTGVHHYQSGTEITVSCGTTPFPSDDPVDGTRYVCTGYTASGSGLTNGADLQITFIIKEETTIEWLWQAQYRVTVTAKDTAMGTATITDVQNGQRDGNYVDEGATVEITATPNTGTVFDHWEVNGVNAGGDNPLTITVDEPKTVVACFKAGQVTLKVNADGRGNPDPPEGDNTYDWGTTLSCKVDAYVDDGQPTRYKCVGWTGTGDVPASGDTNNTGSITLTQDSSITWQWQTQHKVSVGSSGSGSATITGVTGGEWEGDYVEDGATVEITATPDAGNVLDHWQDDTGANLGNANPLIITVDEPKTITAVFRTAVAPSADFTWSPEKPLVGESVQFSDTSTGDIDTWSWDFDNDGAVDSTEQNPTYTYTAAGVYIAKLFVSGPGGSSEVTHQIVVYDGNVYVDDSGDDSNYGTSWSDAVRTIQRGIDLSDPSYNISTVIVGDGVYDEVNIDFKGKSITVKSANGPHNCIIDCQSAGRAFWFHSGETEDSVLDGFTIINGEASGSGLGGCGGGILCSAGASPTIRNCIIRGCHAVSDGSPPDSPDGCGGAIGIYDGAHPTIVNCRIEANFADARAGGIFCFGHVPDTTPIKIINTVIALNEGDDTYGAGGVAIWGSGLSKPCHVEMVNCTVTGNKAANASGGGIYVQFMGRLKIANSIVWGNICASGYADLEATNSTAAADVYNCCINKDASGGNINYNGQNVFKDPQMIAPMFGNYNLDYTSPCIDAGDNTFLPGGVTKDITGRDRLFDGDENGTSIVDIGAYEFAFVKVVAGQSIQDGIDSARDGDTVLVFPGSYSEWSLDLRGKGVVVRGVGGATAVTIDGGGNGPVFKLTSNEPRDAAIVGLTISGGGNTDVGGGIRCFPASIVVKDCVITNNRAKIAGGGIVVRSSNTSESDVVVINCRIEDNKVNDAFSVTCGGGVAVLNGGIATIICCVVAHNEVGASNAGNGGGIYCRNNSYVELHNCLIADNKAHNGCGGGLYAYKTSHIEAVNCTIAYNSSDFAPWSVCLDSASANLTNCIVWTDTGGSQISSGATVNFSCVEGGWTGGVGNIGANAGEEPRFVDPSSENYHLLDGTKCKDAGDDGAVRWGKDLDGRRRIWGTVDMGCYEGEWLIVPDYAANISSAINAADDGDVVVLRDQTFSGVGNVNLDPGGKLLWIRSFSLDPSKCIIDGGDATRIITIQNGETEELLIEGIGFQHGRASSGGAIYISGASPVFKNVIIANNNATNGGGVYIADGSPTFADCLIVRNAAQLGGGVYCQNNGSDFTITFVNCTITNNNAMTTAGGIRTHNIGTNALVRLINCIVYGNTTGGTYAEINAEFCVRAYYSDIKQSESKNVQYVSGCIDSYPDFRDPVSGDYRLSVGSPCIDTGNWRIVTWLFDIELSPRVRGSSVDMGCYEQ